jgi:acid phosphatase
VTQNPAQTGKIVPFTQFSADLVSGQLPSFSFITPNAINDAHDGTLNEADAWLNGNVVPLLSSSLFQKDGLLIITFDEGNDADFDHGGGHVATLIISPKAKKGYKSTTFYQHASVLRLVLESLGVAPLPGAASISPKMNEFFQ